MASSGSCPLNYSSIVEAYFLEHRAKLLDLAAFLDRLDRANDSETSSTDFRVDALRNALTILDDGEGDRARRVLESFSDMSIDIPQSAEGMKGASGAVQEPNA